jgi:hypothetical protein
VEVLQVAYRMLNGFGSVNKQEFMLMRASFFISHNVDLAAFDFVDYSNYSMEEDFAEVVGLGADTWLMVACFFVITTWVGECCMGWCRLWL